MKYETAVDPNLCLLRAMSDGDVRGFSRPRYFSSGWVCHLTDHAEPIVREGFRHGASVRNLAHTRLDQRDQVVSNNSAGYNFAFPYEVLTHDFYDARAYAYGEQAVFCHTAGIMAWHDADRQWEVVFWGPSVESRVPAYCVDRGDGMYDWTLRGPEQAVSGELSAVGEWLQRHCATGIVPW